MAANRNSELTTLAHDFLGAWNTHDAGTVLACYTEDLAYRDPNTRGEVHGSDAMGRYLTKLFANWRMEWRLRELHAFAGGEGANVLWRAQFRQPGTEGVVEVDGMDLVLLQGDRISRNEVQFDRAALLPLLPS